MRSRIRQDATSSLGRRKEVSRRSASTRRIRVFRSTRLHINADTSAVIELQPAWAMPGEKFIEKLIRWKT